MQVSEFTEDHPYWGTLRQSQIPNIKPKVVCTAENGRSHQDRVPTHPTNDGKPPVKKVENDDKKARGRRQRGMSTARRSQGRAREKRFGLADPIVWDALNRSLVQQRRLSSLIIPEGNAAEAIPELNVPSRTSSQRKALNRFTRQLGKYAHAAGATGKLPIITPTESDSKVSYHTIQPLLPYQQEFQAAGLAVTSAEQSRRPLPIHRDSQAHVNRLPGNMKRPRQMNSEFDGQSDAVNEEWSSDSGSFIEFAPAGYPVESVPPSKSKSKQKPPPKEKRGILPWFKKNSPAVETLGNQTEPQQPWQLWKDGQVQSRVKTIDSRNPQDRRHSRAPKDPSTRIFHPSTHMTRPPNWATLSPNAVIPLKPPHDISSPAQIKLGDHGRRSEPAISRANPGLGTGQPIVHTGLRKRDKPVGRLPRPETIVEEKETSPIYPAQTNIRTYPRPESRDIQVPTPVAEQPLHNASQQSTPSTVPSLPYPARYASGRPSSLERALDEVSQQLDKMEQEADRSTQLYSRPATLVEKTDQKEQHASPCRSSQRASMTILPRRPSLKEEFIFVDRKMPPVKPPKPEPESLRPPHRSPPRPPPKPNRDAPTPTQARAAPSPLNEKVLPTTPPTEDILHDLDVFFDYDDADINDRDVIKGLQVAIHAAADDTYDVFIRNETGLRIRRFLADLRAVGEVQPGDSADRSARERRSETRRFQRIQDRKTAHPSK